MEFSEIIGNTETKTQIVVAAKVASDRNTSIPHALFEGPPGTGKTSTARSLAKLTGSQFFQVDPASIKSADDILSIAKKFDSGGYDRHGNVVNRVHPPIVFIDEIHNLPLKGQEFLGIAMENWHIPAPIKKYHRMVHGPSLITIPRFTLIGATTLSGKLSKPFRDRFKMSFRFELYSLEECKLILHQHGVLLGIPITIGAVEDIAKRGRGVPRILVRFLERAYDFALFSEKDAVDTDITKAMFDIMGIDDEGLTQGDIRLLECLYNSNGEPVGLDTLSIFMNEAPSTISNEVEPFLIQQGYIARSPRGRILLDKGAEKIEVISNGR